MGIDIRIQMPRRRARAYVDEETSVFYNIEQGYKECYVLGMSELTHMSGPKRTEPVFVCEFPDGKVINIHTEWVKFLDTDEKGEIVE